MIQDKLFSYSLRVLAISVALTTVTFHAQGTSNNDQSSGSIAKESPADPERAQSPREYIESRLGGKIIKVKKDSSDLLRAELLVERDGSVTRHVLETALDSERNLREVRIITTEGNSRGIPPVILVPLSAVSGCWLHCKEKCGQRTDCRMGCLFDCIVD